MRGFRGSETLTPTETPRRTPGPDLAFDPGTPGAGAAAAPVMGSRRSSARRSRPRRSESPGSPDSSTRSPGADLLITGEGRYDGQSGTGKVVGHAIGASRSAGTRVAVVCGAIGVGAAPVGGYGGPDELVALAELAGGAEHAIADPARWLREAGARLATAFSTHP